MSDKEQKYNNLYMDIAIRIAEMSHAERKKVGAVIVKHGNILGMGWNGTPQGFDNCCEDTLDDGTTKTKREVLHSEMNAILKLAKGTESSLGASIFCTLSPCFECSKAIYSAGIKEVFYLEEYRDTSGIDFLKKCGINVTKL